MPLQISPVMPDQLNAAASLLLGGPGEHPTLAEAAAFLNSLSARGIDVMRTIVAHRGGKVLYAVLPAALAGRSVLFVSGSPQNEEQAALARRMIGALVDQSIVSDATMLQTLVNPTDAEQVAIYLDCGFQRLAELVYLEGNARRMHYEFPPAITVENYRDETIDDFKQAILASYEQTLDCPAMSGVRPIEDVIASHKSAGEFDPSNWFLLRDRGEPVGVLILARIPGTDSMDLVYIGLAVCVRGRGLARELIKLAMNRAAEQWCRRLTTAADSLNRPAVRVYEHAGMHRVGTRLALIRVIHRRGTASSTIHPQTSC